jgi:polyhydroxyalkanoate synthesis regulator phasin
MKTETAEKIEALQEIVNKFQEEIKEKIYEICEGLEYKESSVFSYNIDRLEHFVKELNEF